LRRHGSIYHAKSRLKCLSELALIKIGDQSPRHGIGSDL
jgi:hypothetical protein